MTTLNLYDITVPIFIQSLTTLDAQLTKAEEWAKENNVPLEELTSARLHPDMHPLLFQVTTASNTAKKSVTRITGTELATFEDNEKTFPELHERIAKTIALLKDVKREYFEGKEDADVLLKTGGHEVMFKGLRFAQFFALPNFFFHIVTAYDILRNKGVPVGKLDFLGKPT